LTAPDRGPASPVEASLSPAGAPARVRYSARTLGIAAMVVSALFLMLGDAISKHLMATYPVGQVIALRQGLAVLIILPWALWLGGPKLLRVVSYSGHALRAALFLTGTFLILTAIHLLPLALVTAIAFSSPLFVAMLSASLLGEKVSTRMWIAICAGFAGVLIVVRPGGGSFEWALLLPLAGAAINGLRDIVTRRLARTDHSMSILFWSTLIVGIGGGLLAPAQWVALTPTSTLWFALSSLLNVAAHWTMIEALRLAPAAVVTPFKYTGLLWATLLGILFWNEWPDAWLLLGAAVIVAASIYMVRLPAR
jgi:drug/metabolite transporter (DMT)-like permease